MESEARSGKEQGAGSGERKSEVRSQRSEVGEHESESEEAESALPRYDGRDCEKEDRDQSDRCGGGDGENIDRQSESRICDSQ